jgi:DNA-binding response OmpR family regulator
MLDTRALVVEDERDIRKQIVRTVKRLVLSVDEAADGAEAQKLFEQYAHPLVLLDLRLPELDGMEVLRRIKARHPDSEVIILSAHGDKGDAVEALNLHAFRYLEKPPNITEIEEALRAAYKRFLLLAGRNVAGSPEPDPHPGDGSGELDAEIQDLYARIAALTAQRTQAPEDDALRREYEAVFQRLR